MLGGGATVGELVVKVRPDASQFGAETKQAVERSTVGIGDAIPVAAVVGGIAKITSSAAELEQSIGGTTAVFGEFETAITEWAEGADEAAGLSENAARQLTSQLGGLLQGFGFTQEAAADTSIELAQLGADLAATFGGRPEEAVEALGAALRGEFNPLERFGISLNVAQANLKAVELGLAENTNQVSLQARAQASLAIITERSGQAQGQFARELNTASGQAAVASAKAENAAASLGENFLPIYAKLSEVVGTTADVFGKLPPSVQTATIVLGAVAALAGPAARTFNSLTDAVGNMGDRFSSASPQVQNLGRGLVVAGGAAAGVYALAEGIETLVAAYNKGRFGDLADNTDRLADSLNVLADGTVGGVLAEDIEGLSGAFGALNEEATGWRGVATDVRDGLDQLPAPTAKLGTSLSDLRDGGEEATRQLAAVDQALVQLINSDPGRGKAAFYALRAELEAMGVSAEDIEQRLPGATGAIKDMLDGIVRPDTSGLDRIAEKNEDIKDAADKARKAQDRLNDSLMGRVDAAFALRDAQWGIRDAELDVADATRDVADARREAAEAQAAIRDAQNAVSDAERRLNELRRGGDPHEIAKAELDLANSRGSVAAAGLAVTDAERKLAEARAKGDPHEIAKAELDLQEARRGVSGAELSVADAEKKLNEARQGGSPEEIADAERQLADERQRLVDAQREAAEAPYQIERAERALIEAHRDLEQAHIDVVRAQQDVTGSYRDAADAINEGGLSSVIEYRAELERIAATSPEAAGGIEAIREQIRLLDEAIGSGALQIATEQMGLLGDKFAAIIAMQGSLDKAVLGAGSLAGNAGALFGQASSIYNYLGADQFSLGYGRNG